MTKSALILAALLSSTSIALAQQDKGPAGGNGPAANSPSTNAPSSAPGQAKPSGESAKPSAPGQMKGDDQSARDYAPGRERDADNKAGDAKQGKQSDDRSDMKNNDRKDRDSADNDRGDKKGDSTKNAEGDRKTGSSTGTSAGTEGKDSGKAKPSLSLSGEQKTKVRSAFTKHHGSAPKNIGVSVNVGVVIPRSVTVLAIPQDIVIIAPEYRSYRYFWIDDERVAIVDPDTFEVVDIIIVV